MAALRHHLALGDALGEEVELRFGKRKKHAAVILTHIQSVCKT